MPKDEKNKVKQWVHKKEHWADENPKKNCHIFIIRIINGRRYGK